MNDYFYCIPRTYDSGNHKVDYLIESLLPRKGLAVLMGDSGSGKTLLATRIAGCVATGAFIAPSINDEHELPFDFGICAQTGVSIYFAGEGKQGIISRIISAETALNEELKSLPDSFKGQLPIMVLAGKKRRLSGVSQIDEMLSEAASFLNFYSSYGYPLRLMIFDTLAASFEIHDENNNSEMQKIVETLNEYGERFNCLILAIAHPPKSPNGKPGFTRGASAFINSADVVFELNKINKSKCRKLTVTKMRDGPAEDTMFFMKIVEFDGVPALIPDYGSNNQTNNSKKVKNKELTAHQQNILNIIAKMPKGQATLSNMRKVLLPTNTAELQGNDKIKAQSLNKTLRRTLKKFETIGKVTRYEENGNVFYVTDYDNETSTDTVIINT